MISEISFAGPSKKNFLKPTSKSVFREKERKRRKKKKELRKQQLAELKKKEKEKQASKADLAKELGTKEYLSFFANCHDFKNYYQKPHKLAEKKTLLIPQQQHEDVPDEVTHTEFLNPAEYKEIKGSIDDLSFGEMVMKFINPDDESYEDHPVTFSDAEKVFEDILTVVGPGSIPKSLVLKQRKAFLLAFLQLQDYIIESIDDDDPKNKKQGGKSKTSVFGAPFQMIKSMAKSPSKMQNEEEEEQTNLNKRENEYSYFLEKYLTISENQEQYTRQEYLDALANVKFKDMTKIKEVEKKYVRGNYLFKQFTEDHSDWDWICNDTQPKDFTTLMRNTIMVKLCRDAHMHVRSFLSSDGKFIFVVIKSQPETSMKYAEVMGIPKQYELGYADLFSLEPTDSSMRPLRLKPYIRDPEYLQANRENLDEIREQQGNIDKKSQLERIESKAQKIYQQSKKWGEHELRLNIVAKQQQVDVWLKNIARQLHVDRSHERAELIEDVIVDREVWEAYYLYLEFIDDFCKRMEKVQTFKEVQYNRELLNSDQTSEGERRLNDLYVSLKDGAEPTDFNSESLADSAGFHCFHPWHIPIQNLRDYFGEKVALYFSFLSFYTRQLFLLSVIAIICQFVIDKAPAEGRKAFLVIWAVVITIWSSVFNRLWLQQQCIFQIQFGQMGFSKSELVIRPAFEGTFYRSFINDNLNDEVYPGWIYKGKMILSLIITISILVLVVGCCFAVFLLKETIRESTNNSFAVNTVPSLINSILIQIFNAIYFFVCDGLNNFENHKYVQAYENSLIIKNFAFIFVNTFASMFIVAFLDDLFPFLHICLQASGAQNCFEFLQSQMISIFIVNFAKNIPEMLAPCIKVLIRSGERKQDDTPVIHEFLEIDTFIEDQSLLESYQTNAEVDGTVADYMEMVIQYSFLTLFGLAFPLSYFLAFLSNVLEIQVDKVKLVYFSQRPLPAGAADIGNWFVLMELVNFLGICSNAGLVAYTSGAVVTNNTNAFIALLVVLLGVRYLTTFFIPEQPRLARQVMKRQRFAVDRVLRGISSSAGGYRPGIAKMKIDCVDYSKIDSNLQQNLEHTIKGPNVILFEDRK